MINKLPLPDLNSRTNRLMDLKRLTVGSTRAVKYPVVDPTLLSEILFITTYPPRECGIATYSRDLIGALNNQFDTSFKINVCPLESANEQHQYQGDIQYKLNTDEPESYTRLSKAINENKNISIVVIQHEFGFFENSLEQFDQFITDLKKPVVMVFHTVLPHPSESLRERVRKMASVSESIIVMTKSSSEILKRDYEINTDKIAIIPHGTHLIKHADKESLKKKYGLFGKKILSTFGLLGWGKNIETTLEALPAIVKIHPDTLFLIIGKTHPTIALQEGEKYREMLEEKIKELQMTNHVRFVNYFLPLTDLLEYLQLTDIYLFTSKDPHQAVSGTFAYAISAGCPVISTPIPHATEVLKDGAGIIIDFESPTQLQEAVNNLLANDTLRKEISSNGLHSMASTVWENAAIAHALLFEKIDSIAITLNYNIPSINLNHVGKMTTDFGMIQFSKINQPDIDSGYTLDDNARALVAICQHLELTKNEDDLEAISIYFNFIKHCLQPEVYFLNYVNEQRVFTEQNNTTNLADANGRAIWALGYMISLDNLLPSKLIEEALVTMKNALVNVNKIHSTRAMAFAIKGIYYSNQKTGSAKDLSLLTGLANRLVQMYRHEADKEWQWFESYLTYANSILPEAMLCAWLASGELIYLEIAKSSFDFLLSKCFSNDSIKVISNKGWMHKGEEKTLAVGGEQPIDVAYTIMALDKFYDVFRDESYKAKMTGSFNWFLGDNHLHQIIYNPCTGGCYDGLEENNVNLNQGAESTLSYLMARLTIEKTLKQVRKRNAILPPVIQMPMRASATEIHQRNIGVN